jgi:hypothetical protein
MSIHLETRRSTVYTDEMYFHGRTTKQHTWISNQEMRLKIPTSKGHRVTVVHIGGREDFIPNVMLMF